MPDVIPGPPDLSPEEIVRLFPLKRDRLAEDIFELGLVLAGTVSAGTYTAGVLDFLTQALDAWTEARDRGGDVPSHKVVLSTIGGTSGGGINAAIFTRAISFAFTHGAVPENPFFSTWIGGVNLQSMLKVTDGDPLTELLDTSILQTKTEATLRFGETPPALPKSRAWLADPLRTIITVTNLTGIPYRIKMSGTTDLGHDLVAHADWLRFGLTTAGAADPVGHRADELALEPQSGANWPTLGLAARATCAFPIAFRSIGLTRALAGFGYRVQLVPGDATAANPMLRDDTALQMIPLWPQLRGGLAEPAFPAFVNVDGGVTNNEPLDIVRTAMAGLTGRNPREGVDAHRATIMVDPFSDAEPLGPVAPPGLAKLAGAVLSTLLMQARFKPVDIALAQSDWVYSRFLIAPIGPNATVLRAIGTPALASGGLGGFLGFVDETFLTHDFALGRANACGFLMNSLHFPEYNPIFDAWTEPQRAAHCLKDGAGKPIRLTDDRRQRQLPLIPLMPGLVETAPVPATWPVLKETPSWLPGAIAARLDWAVKQAKSALLAPDAGDTKPRLGWLSRTAMSAGISIVWTALRGTLRAAANAAIDQELKVKGLVRPLGPQA